MELYTYQVDLHIDGTPVASARVQDINKNAARAYVRTSFNHLTGIWADAYARIVKSDGSVGK